MSLMLFIWCFDSLLAPYPMNSFFYPLFSKTVRTIDKEDMKKAWLVQEFMEEAKLEGKAEGLQEAVRWVVIC